MRRLFALGLALALATVAPTIAPPPTSAITSDYTLPFFNRAIGVTQVFGCTGFYLEPPYGSCAHYHSAIDYATGSGPVVASRAGVIADLVETNPNGNGTCPVGTHANYVLINHGGGEYTFYMHVAPNSVLLGVGVGVSAGQQIATSGSSGCTTAAHLHYSLFLGPDWTNTALATNPEGHWTTNPGRVPWHGVFQGSESHPSGFSTFSGLTTTVWVEFRNDGGRPWSATNPTYGNGRIVLVAVTSSGTAFRTSPFSNTPDWESVSVVGRADPGSVAVGAVGRFTFKMRAPSVGQTTVFQGASAERFSLRASGLAWFDYLGSTNLNGYWLGPITVQPF